MTYPGRGGKQATAEVRKVEFNRPEGWSEPGRWNPGRYRVELYISGARTASGEFEITVW